MAFTQANDSTVVALWSQYLLNKTGFLRKATLSCLEESFWAYNAIYQGRLSSQQAREIGIFLKEIYLLERNPPTQTYFDVSG